MWKITSLARKDRGLSHSSMFKVAFAGEDHCDIGLVGGGYDFVVLF